MLWVAAFWLIITSSISIGAIGFNIYNTSILIISMIVIVYLHYKLLNKKKLNNLNK